MISRRWLFSGSSAPPATISSASCGEKKRFSRLTFSSWRDAVGDALLERAVELGELAALPQQLVVERLDAQQRAHAREQLGLAHRLAEEVVGAGVEALGALLGRVERGDEDDRQHRVRRVGADRAAHVVAAHAGHHHVEQDEVGPLGGEHGERLGARGRGAGAVALRREQVGEQLDVQRDVVDDEDLGAGGSVDGVHSMTSSARSEQRLRDRDAERLRGLQVDAQAELGRPLDRQVAGARAFQDPRHLQRRPAHQVVEVGAVGDQEAGLRLVRPLADERPAGRERRARDLRRDAATSPIATTASASPRRARANAASRSFAAVRSR